LDVQQVQWIAFSVLGMYWMMAGIVDLFRIGFQLIWLSELLGMGEEVARRLRGQVAYHVFEVALGVALTLGARGLTTFLQKVRYVGSSGMTPKMRPESEDPNS
jgi:hypothetical protein